MGMKTCYRLKITAEPRGVPPEIRLRRFLKTALRVFGLRCTEVLEESPAIPPAAPPADSTNTIPNRPR